MTLQCMQHLSTPLLLFSFTMSVPPGLNSMMRSVSGANFGFRRTPPHIAGILAGMNLLFICAASGMATVRIRFPAVHWALKN